MHINKYLEYNTEVVSLFIVKDTAHKLYQGLRHNTDAVSSFTVRDTSGVSVQIEIQSITFA